MDSRQVAADRDAGGDTEAARLRRLCHDVRQYVAAGWLLADMPESEAADFPADRRLARLAKIFAALHDMLDTHAHVTSDCLDLVDLELAVTDCVEILSVASRITVVPAADAAVLVRVDPIRLRRVIGNLIHNAARATGESGSIVVHLGREGSMAYVEVRDDGVGFGRVPSGDGQGMGVVSSFVQASRGALEIRTGPGPGTTVRVSLPAHDKEES
jgi:signal transduction histidine kinase